MRKCFFIILLTFFIRNSFSQDKIFLSSGFGITIAEELKPFYTLSSGQMEDLLKGEVISDSKVASPSAQEQELILFVSGIHPRNCTKAMRKLSLYENYQLYMDFIKESHYDEKTQKFSFTIDHTLLPFPMIVKFKIPRIKGDGHYPFVFEDGFLKDLKGQVVIRSIGKYCLMGLKSDWRGPKTKIPNMVFSSFLQTVGKIGLEHLIRVSLF